MSQDVVADGLNMIRNAIKAGKKNVKVNRMSNPLIEVLKIMKNKKAIKTYKVDGKEKSVNIILNGLVECRAVKPRFSVKNSQIEKYMRRYLPARNIGTMIISTNNGLMTHDEAIEEKTGGCLIAYFY